MTAYNPPSNIYFNGIGFNPTIIEQGNTVSTSGGGLTQAQANLLYLRKTVIDTATAVETFSSGIYIPTVNSTGSLFIYSAYTNTNDAGSNVIIGSNSNGVYIGAGVPGVVEIDAISTGNIDIGTSCQLIGIGNSLSTTTLIGQVLADSISSNGGLVIDSTTGIIIDNAGQGTVFNGNIYTTYLDTVSAVNLYLGTTIAAAIQIGNGSITTTFPGEVSMYQTLYVGDIVGAGSFLGINSTGNPTLFGGAVYSNHFDTNTATILYIGDTNATTVSIGSSTSNINLLGPSTAPTVSYPNNSTRIATTAYVTAAISASGGISLSGNNTWTGANDFTGGSIVMTTQTAGNNTTFGASTAFVTAAISALSSVYQTSTQVNTAITSALTTFKATANTFSANQIFSTIQFSTGTLNQAFYIQHVNAYSFGAVAANTAVTQTFSYSTLGMTNYTTFITAQICNSSSSAQGNRVLFSIQAQSASSFTIVGYNVTATNTSASAFSLVVYGR